MEFRKSYLFVFVVVFAALVFYLKPSPRRLESAFAVSSSVETPSVAPSAAASNLEDAFIRVALAVKPAVVNISTVYIEKVQTPDYEFFFGSPFDGFFEEFFSAPRPKSPSRPPSAGSPRTRRHEGTGSGVVISPDGYILTNEHVVRSADEINVTITSADGSEKKYKGKVIGKDTRTDLAVIKISGSRFAHARLGNSDGIKVGQWVIAIGSPFGLEQTVTTGIVSAKRQALSIEGRTYRDLIQTDAAINRGNSGGPLCDIAGEVVGINTAIYAPTGVFSGIGFAVPINRAKAILDELIKTGKVTRGWLGVEVRPVDAAIEKNFGLSAREGALIAGVMEGSPASRAGLKRGDVILEFEGRKIKTPVDLQDAVAALSPDKKASVRLMRDGKELRVSVVVSGAPDDADASGAAPSPPSAEGTSYRWEGMAVADITAELRAAYAVAADVKGVIVMEVQDLSRAASIGLMAGDVIKSLNNRPTATIQEFKRAASSAVLSKGVVFDIVRDGRSIYLTYSEE